MRDGDPHLHGMQCCPACWRGHPTHVSEFEDGVLCDCEPLPPMTEADLAAYDAKHPPRGSAGRER